ncbi:hypothetical protein, partial [Pseudomonas pergaminensis]
MSASAKKVRAFSQSRTQKARNAPCLLSIGSICRNLLNTLETNVGAGLPAIAVDQSIHPVTV